MSNEKKNSGYLIDLIALIKEEAKEAKLIKDNSEKKDLDYNIGYLMAFHQVIALMKHQAIAFDIDQEELQLADIEPERDLL